MSIERRGKNKWLIRLYMGKDPITKKRRGFSEIFIGTESEAKEREKDLKAERRLKKLILPPHMTLNNLIESYLKTSQIRVSPTTHEKKVKQLQLWIQPELGELQLKDLDEDVLQAHINYLLAPKEEEED